MVLNMHYSIVFAEIDPDRADPALVPYSDYVRAAQDGRGRTRHIGRAEALVTYLYFVGGIRTVCRNALYFSPAFGRRRRLVPKGRRAANLPRRNRHDILGEPDIIRFIRLGYSIVHINLHPHAVQLLLKLVEIDWTEFDDSPYAGAELIGWD